MATIRREGEMNLSDLYKVYKKDGGELPYNKYKEVMNVFVKNIMTKIMITGYRFSMPYHCGLMQVIQLERKVKIKDNGNIKGSVDWGESNKLKQKIIDDGGLPLKMFKDDKGNIVGDNGGQAWICYFTTPTYFKWAWTAHINMKNCLRYTFDVTRDNSNTLHENINDNSYILFKLRKNNGNNKDYLNRVLIAAGAK